MKKLLCLVLAAMMCLSFASCGKKEKASTDGVPTLSWYIPGDAQQDLPAVLAEANKIVEKEIGAKIDIKFIDQGSYDERMKMNMASKTNMDLVFTGYVLKPQTAIELGGLYDITDILKKETPHLYNDLIPDYVWKCAQVNDRLYSVPNLQILCQVSALCFNKELVDKYKFDVSSVKCAKDAEPFLQKVRDNEPDYIPARNYYTFSGPNYEANYQHIVCMDRNTGKMVYEYARPETLAELKEAHEWYKKGYLRADITTTQDDTADYLAGRYATFTAANLPGVESQLKGTIGKEYVTVPTAKNYLSTTSAIATQIGVSATTKHPELCVKFIELINDNKELYNLICFGIKDKHYKLNSDNRVEYIENSGYAPKADWKFGNQFNAMLLPGQPDDVWEQTIKANDEAQKSLVLGLIFKTDELKSEITQCTNIKSQYTIPVDVDDYESRYKILCDKMEEAGAAKILANYQKQVDDYRAKNK